MINILVIIYIRDNIPKDNFIHHITEKSAEKYKWLRIKSFLTPSKFTSFAFSNVSKESDYLIFKLVV